MPKLLGTSCEREHSQGGQQHRPERSRSPKRNADASHVSPLVACPVSLRHDRLPPERRVPPVPTRPRGSRFKQWKPRSPGPDVEHSQRLRRGRLARRDLPARAGDAAALGARAAPARAAARALRRRLLRGARRAAVRDQVRCCATPTRSGCCACRSRSCVRDPRVLGHARQADDRRRTRAATSSLGRMLRPRARRGRSGARRRRPHRLRLRPVHRRARPALRLRAARLHRRARVGRQHPRQVQLLEDLGAEILCCTPSYALAIADHVAEPGRTCDLRCRRRVRRRALDGGACATRSRRRSTSGARHLRPLRGDRPGVAVECLEGDGLHVNEDHFLVEVVDPATRRAAAPTARPASSCSRR